MFVKSMTSLYRVSLYRELRYIEVRYIEDFVIKRFVKSRTSLYKGSLYRGSLNRGSIVFFVPNANNNVLPRQSKNPINHFALMFIIFLNNIIC